MVESFIKTDIFSGEYVITGLLKELILAHSKDKHMLTMSDIEIKDKMKFEPTIKMINSDMISYLEKTIPNSHGTVLVSL